jgi:hypothetical protein
MLECPRCCWIALGALPERSAATRRYAVSRGYERLGGVMHYRARGTTLADGKLADRNGVSRGDVNTSACGSGATPSRWSPSRSRPAYADDARGRARGVCTRSNKTLRRPRWYGNPHMSHCLLGLASRTARLVRGTRLPRIGIGYLEGRSRRTVGRANHANSGLRTSGLSVPGHRIRPPRSVSIARRTPRDVSVNCALAVADAGALPLRA